MEVELYSFTGSEPAKVFCNFALQMEEEIIIPQGDNPNREEILQLLVKLTDDRAKSVVRKVLTDLHPDNHTLKKGEEKKWHNYYTRAWFLKEKNTQSKINNWAATDKFKQYIYYKAIFRLALLVYGEDMQGRNSYIE